MQRCVIAMGLLCLTQGLLAEEVSLTGHEWHDSLQRIGAKYRRGTTAAQNGLLRKQLIAELDAVGSKRVTLQGVVKEVRWKNGVAEVYAELSLTAPAAGAAKPLLRLYRVTPLELLMKEEDAASIEPGSKVQFVGTLQFHPGGWGAVGRSSKTQQMHTLSHEELVGTPLGTFTSPDCAVIVNGKSFPARWAKDRD